MLTHSQLDQEPTKWECTLLLAYFKINHGRGMLDKLEWPKHDPDDLVTHRMTAL
jgi:hypothetical protein